MRCLVVGGTGFLGGAIVDALSAAGHEVTALSRGLADRTPPDGVRALSVDRHGDLGALDGLAFDWAFDTCAYEPGAVARLLEALGGDLSRYVLISSLSVYGRYEAPGLTEDAPAPDAGEADHEAARAVPPDRRASAVAYGASYGPLKRACEREAARRLGDRASAPRVGLLVGAGDYTDRLTWWVRRIDEARGPRLRVPAPGPPGRAVQVIDVRDAADFALRCAEDGLGGVWNVVGRPMPLSALLGAIREVAGSEAELIWRPEQAVTDAGARPWTDVPLMAPAVPQFRHFLEVDASRARAAGLMARPLAETLGPLLAWDRGRRDVPLQGGLSPEQEAALLGPADPPR